MDNLVRNNFRGAIKQTINQTPVEAQDRRAEKLVDDEASRILNLVHKK